MDPLHFREKGSKDKEAIVLIHGGGMTGKGWQTALRTMPEYHFLVPDLPGSGRSAHIAPLGLENAVEGLADLIRANVASGRAAVVGLSVGADVAIGLFQQHPDLVEKAFLTGATPRLSRAALLAFVGSIRSSSRNRLGPNPAGQLLFARHRPRPGFGPQGGAC